MTDPQLSAVPLPPPGDMGADVIDFDFFGGTSKTEKWYFPDQDVQYIEFSVMNEGQRSKFQSRTSRDIKVSRKDQSAAIRMDAASDRRELILEVVCDWRIFDKKSGSWVNFNKNIFTQWYNRADPRLIDKLERAIRDANPWMQDEMDAESIREEINRLEELEKEAIDRESRKENF